MFLRADKKEKAYRTHKLREQSRSAWKGWITRTVYLLGVIIHGKKEVAGSILDRILQLLFQWLNVLCNGLPDNIHTDSCIAMYYTIS